MGSGQYSLNKEDTKILLDMLDKYNVYYEDGEREIQENGDELPFHTTNVKIVICSVEDEIKEYKPYIQIDR